MNRSVACFSLLSLLALTATPVLAGGQSKGKTTTTTTPAKKPDPPKKPEPTKKSGVGSEPDSTISLNDATGKAHALKDYRGSILVVEFWSMDAASEAYSKRVATLSEELGKKGVAFVAIDSSAADVGGGDADAGKKIAEHATKNGITFPVLLDKGEGVAHKLGAKFMPEVMVLDAKGIIRYAGAIDDDPKGEKADKANHYLRSALEALIAGKEVATATTTATGTPITADKPAPAPTPAPPKK